MVLLSHLMINELSVYYATRGSISLFSSTENYSERQGNEIISFVPGLPFFPLRIPFDRLRAAVSPIPKSRKERRPPASHFRNDFMALQALLLPFGIIEENSPTVTSKKATVFLMQRRAGRNRRGLFSPSHVSSSYRVSGIQD